MDGNAVFEQKVRRMLGVTDDTVPVVIESETYVQDSFCDTCSWNQIEFSITVGDESLTILGLINFLERLDMDEDDVPDEVVIGTNYP